MMSAQTVEQMEEYVALPLLDNSYQALALRYREGLYNREGIYYHVGVGYGAYNCISYDPVTGDGVVVLTTGAYEYKDAYEITKVCSEINAYIYARLDD